MASRHVKAAVTLQQIMNVKHAKHFLIRPHMCYMWFFHKLTYALGVENPTRNMILHMNKRLTGAAYILSEFQNGTETATTQASNSLYKKQSKLLKGWCK